MILTKEVEVKIINEKLLNYYKKYYPDLKKGDTILIPVEKLQPNSNKKVKVKCNNCGEENEIKYVKYNKKNGYYCKKCYYISIKKTNKRRYGVENQSQIREIVDKKKKKYLDKHGVDNPMKLDSVKNKLKQTNLKKYGVDNPMKNLSVIEKVKETNLEKYGVTHHMKTDISKEKIKKSNLEKYGVEHYTQTEEYKNKYKSTCLEKYGVENYSHLDIFKEKSKKSNLEKYGVDNPMKLDEIKDKIKQTNLEKYGVESPMLLDSVKDKMKTTYLKNKSDEIISKYYELLSEEYEIINYNYGNFNILHKKCGESFNIKTNNLYDRLRYMSEDICLNCFPFGLNNTSIKENEVIKWLEEIGIKNIITNNRNIISGKELDIYLPDYKLAIEFNGIYWHNELFKNKNYHLDKTESCQKQGIHLIHIWEDDWLYKKDIVKSIILNKLGLITNKIYARKCEVRQIEVSKISTDFLEENHIQGKANSKYKLGLYYNNKLVSIMNFSYRYMNGKKVLELVRFCNKKDIIVVGSASKLFKYFLNNFEINDSIISYADISIFDGNLYSKLGFKYDSRTKPNYFWVVDNIRKHRFTYNKKKLIKEGFDPAMSEVEIMNNRGYYRIWGCGQDKYIFN
jgi:hypothetical protein